MFAPPESQINCGGLRDPNIVWCRKGLRYAENGQLWPIYRRPPRRFPLAVGGACPPYAPLTKIHWQGGIGYSCVERALGSDMQTPAPETKTIAAYVAAGLVLGGVIYYVAKGKRS